MHADAVDARFLPAQALRHAGAKRIGLLAVKDVVRAEYSIDTVQLDHIRCLLLGLSQIDVVSIDARHQQTQQQIVRIRTLDNNLLDGWVRQILEIGLIIPTGILGLLGIGGK